MKLNELLDDLKSGKCVTRDIWSEDWYVKLGSWGELDFYMRSNDKIIEDINLWFADDIEANDWEVVK